MWAIHNGCGLHISLNLKDKNSVKSKKVLECLIEPNTKLFLHIWNRVPWQGFLEEPGFHITAKPESAPPEKRKRYDIYLSREKWEGLTNPRDDPIVVGGYTASRCIYDRVDINYF